MKKIYETITTVALITFLSIPFFTQTAVAEEAVNQNPSGDVWYEITSDAPWGENGGISPLSYNGKIWVVENAQRDILGFSNEVWNSINGSNWTLVTASVPFGPRHNYPFLEYDGKIWVIGGMGENYYYYNDVWNSTDGSNWTLVTANAPWSARGFSPGVVFDNKMWIIGGGEMYGAKHNDVWCSTDGTNWTLVTANAPWTGRFEHPAVVYDNKMWIMGGNKGSGSALNDVWCSSNGSNWTEVTANANWTKRDAFPALIFDNKMWVLGGRDSGGGCNDVWNSTDGINWTEVTHEVEWSARYFFPGVVYNNEMWIFPGTPGNDAVRLRDVWCTAPLQNNNGEYALTFDGDDDYVDCGTDASIQFTKNFTFEAWIYATETNSEHKIVDKTTDGSDKQYSFEVWDGKLVLQYEKSANNAWMGGGTILPDTWTHVAVTMDDSLATRLYINGNQVTDGLYHETDKGYGTWSGGYYTFSTEVVTKPNHLLIGRSTSGMQHNGWHFEGKIDEVRAWNKALSKSQIQANMNKHLTGNEAGLAGYWRFDEDSGQTAFDSSSNDNNGRLGSTEIVDDEDPEWVATTWPHGNTDPNEGLIAYYPFNGNANDESGNGNHGTVNGATLTSDKCENENSAYKFDGGQINGNGDYIEVPNSSSLNNLEKISVSFWTRRFTNVGAEHRIIGKHSNEGDMGWAFSWEWRNTDFKEIYFKIANGEVITGGNIPTNEWVHIVGTYDGTTNKLYVNGSLIAENQSTGNEVLNANVSLDIGRFLASGIAYYKGEIDEVRIYNRAISNSEIIELHNGCSNQVQDISVLTSSLSIGYENQSYSAILEATGGTEPYTWSITSGQLPTGISLSASGDLSGTPTTIGGYSFVARVTDADNDFDEANLSITIEAIESVEWYEITSDAPWSGRHGHSCTEFKGKIWLLGGLSSSTYNNEIWSSSDGANWTLEGDADWSKRGYHATAVFDNKLWVFGGSDGNDGFVFLNDVWSSEDGINWICETSNASWLARTGLKAYVYNDKLWIVGGMHDNKTEYASDVWSSTDGKKWEQVTSLAPWGERGFHDAFVFKNKMWVMGGVCENWVDYSKDVWSSTDGTNWTLVTDDATCAERFYTSAAVFDGKIWICGSYHHGEQNDVWSSPNGSDWTLEAEHAIWVDRCAQSVFVFDSELWIAGGEGNFNKQLNDVWCTKPLYGHPVVLTSTLPAVQVDATYSATLEADGGTDPYTWSITSGQLPTGISLSASGDLSGTPTSAGVYSFVVRVTDADNDFDEANLSIIVADGSDTTPPIVAFFYPKDDTNVTAIAMIAIDSSNIDTARSIVEGERNTVNASVVSSVGDVHFLLADGVELKPGNNIITATIYDSEGNKSTASIKVIRTGSNGNLIIVTESDDLNGFISESYLRRLEAKGGDDEKSWVINGLIPDIGLDFTRDGTIAGEPQTEGEYELFVSVTSGGQQVSTTLVLKVETQAKEPMLLNDVVVDGIVYDSYSSFLQITGSENNEEWKFEALAGLPDNVTLSQK